MYVRTADLISELHARFGHTTDNNRDLMDGDIIPQSEVQIELDIEHAYKTIVNYLSHTPVSLDKACWGVDEPDDQAHHNH